MHQVVNRGYSEICGCLFILYFLNFIFCISIYSFYNLKSIIKVIWFYGKDKAKPNKARNWLALLFHGHSTMGKSSVEPHGKSTKLSQKSTLQFLQKRILNQIFLNLLVETSCPLSSGSLPHLSSPSCSNSASL